jgi:hypothetical protein
MLLFIKIVWLLILVPWVLYMAYKIFFIGIPREFKTIFLNYYLDELLEEIEYGDEEYIGDNDYRKWIKYKIEDFKLRKINGSKIN